jgi:nucleotide-binding universal stress UspA family protein/nitroimidazol reductase NimA-like FMN-containing flavoprotein (pyridoxamine 5'-phosphate oxidase superfamily)
MTSRGFDVLTEAESRELLATKSFGRVVTKVSDAVAAFPVFYALVDGDIVFRTDPGTKLAAAVLRTRVTFEVDDEAGGWSVMAEGYCDEVRWRAPFEIAHRALETHWPDAERQHVVRIRPIKVTGRRLQSHGETTRHTSPAQHIVVGVDHSEGSRYALEWAIAEARARHASVEAVHAWHYPYVATGPFVPTPAYGHDGFEADASQVLDASVAGVDAEGLAAPVERTLVCDAPVAALLAAAKDADLLVVGSRGRGGFAGLLLGSVSQAVVHHAQCPVVVVPPAERRNR